MEKKSRKKGAISLIILITMFSTSCFFTKTLPKNKVEPELIPYLWKIDSCGNKGFRSEIHRLYFLDKNLKLSGRKNILDFLPNPNNIREDLEANEIIYSYIIESNFDCKYPSKYLLMDMTVIVNLQTYKVSTYYSDIY